MYRKLAKQRLLFSYVMALLAIVFAPKHLWWPGAVIVAMGVAMRFWAAGHIVKVDKLSQGGPYACTRNPLYFGSFLGAMGTFLMVHNWLLMGVFLVGFYFFYGSTIRSEEEFLGGKYGEDFVEYKRNVPVFFPRLIPHKTVGESRFSWGTTRHNNEMSSALCTLAMVVLLAVVSHFK